jgi:hypothetical protein
MQIPIFSEKKVCKSVFLTKFFLQAFVQEQLSS